MPAEPASSAARYRADIDGLRALAILPVVFYHFRVPGFGGGFVGVDIFFVISGYLITGLLTDTERPMSLLTFYARRIRRLAPALAVMLAGVTVAALVLLPPNPFIAYGKSLISVAVGGSNIFFWRALATYFAPAGENHLLLHTWSLAVEEQFYLVFPLFLAGLRRWSGRSVVIGVGGAAALSLALAAVLAPRSPSASFYLAPTRAWELLFGALLALRGSSWSLSGRWATVGGLAGLAMVAIAVVTFTVRSQVPGPAALLPCLGALLLIHVGEAEPTNPVSRLLASRPLVGVGLISYALYLWHWPINVGLRRYVLTEPPGPAVTILAMAAAFGLAMASWALIERPIRKGRWLAKPWRTYAFAATMAAALFVVGGWMATSDGLPHRFPGLDVVRMQIPDRKPRYNLLSAGHATFPDLSGWRVQKADPAAHRVLIWGDSYARHLVPGFDALQDRYSFSVFVQTEHGCPPVMNFLPRGSRFCRDRNADAWRIIRDEKIDTVILGGRWESYTMTGKMDPALIKRTVQSLQAQGLTVLVVGQPPTYDFDFPDEYHYLRMRGGAPVDTGWATSAGQANYNDGLRRLLGDIVFDPMPVFCQGQLCDYRDHGLYVVADSGHLTAYGSQRMVAALLKAPLMQQVGAQP